MRLIWQKAGEKGNVNFRTTALSIGACVPSLAKTFGFASANVEKNEDYSSYLDWKYGNFFETKEKAEQAAVDWVTEIVNQMVLDGKFALKIRCLNEDELKRWENIRGIDPVVLGVE